MLSTLPSLKLAYVRSLNGDAPLDHSFAPLMKFAAQVVWNSSAASTTEQLLYMLAYHGILPSKTREGWSACFGFSESDWERSLMFLQL